MSKSVLLPSRPYIESEEGNKAEIVIEGLHPGYGVTLGNAVRRVLISSLEGAAVTRVKIEGVQHEFSTVPGVLEDVLVILLNLKQVRFRMFSDEPQTFSFDVSGEREVTAADIEAPSTLEVVNPEQHIATITKKSAKLSVELTVEKGVGYRAKENAANEKVEVGVIILDAIFTPVRKVSYRVDNMRVGTETDYNKLTVEIETDGTITPKDAFLQALEIVMSHMSEIKQFRQKGEIMGENEHGDADQKPENAAPDISIEDVKFSRHTLNALAKGGIETIKDLSERSEADLRLMEGIGDRAMEEVKRELESFGMNLK